MNLFFLANTYAHEGPPYPILVDHQFNEHKLSVWADPDTGNGSFYFYPEGVNKKEFRYEITASPQANPLHLIKGETDSLKLVIPFDQNLMWNVTIRVKDKVSQSTLTTKTLALEVTPPGPNKLEFAIYLVPFIILAIFWAKIILIKQKKKS